LAFAAVTNGELPDTGAFGAAFEDFMHAMTAAAQRPESALAIRVREHFGDPRELPSTAVDAGAIALSDEDFLHVVARTEGVSGAFVKEVMRQAALRAALDGREPGGADVRAVLDELLDDRSLLTRRLLGRPADGAPAGAPAAPPPVAMVHALGAAGLPVPPGLFEP